MASKNNKLVRDSFTMPKGEYAAIDALKERALVLGTLVKKSELLRAGLKLLQGLNDAAYLGAMAAVPTLKTGRPSGQSAAAPEALPGAPVPKKVVKAPVKASVKAAARPVAKPTVKPAAKVAAKVPTKRVPAKTAVVAKATKPAGL